MKKISDSSTITSLFESPLQWGTCYTDFCEEHSREARKSLHRDDKQAEKKYECNWFIDTSQSLNQILNNLKIQKIIRNGNSVFSLQTFKSY